MADKTTGVMSTTEVKMMSGELANVFKLSDEGNLIVRNEALANLISEQSKLPQRSARGGEVEVSVSVSVKF